MPKQPWRDRLQPASYGGARFKVEVDTQGGGRRNATHEFPHRDEPWTEDMGRRARRWTVSGYLIGPQYIRARDALIAVFEAEGPHALVHPTLGTVQANIDEYEIVERRELGGFCLVEMRFVEAGSQPGTKVTSDTRSQVKSAADSSDAAAANSANTSLGGGGGIGSDYVASRQAAAAGSVGSFGSATSDLASTGGLA